MSLRKKWKRIPYVGQVFMQPMDGRVSEAMSKFALRSEIPSQGFYLMDVVDNFVRLPIHDPIMDSLKK